MSKVQSLTDEALLKRAGHAGRNLSAIAILATISTALLLLGVCLSPHDSSFLWPTVFFALATVAYWILAVAARRGNPTPVTVVMGVMAVQFLGSLATFVVATVRRVPASGFQLLLVTVALLVIVALARNRDTLVEMKRRGIWQGRFDSARSSVCACWIGGIALVVGYAGFVTSLFVPAVQAAQQANERQQAQKIVQSILADEAEFMKAMQAIGTGGHESVKLAIAKLDNLDRHLVSFQAGIPMNGTLARVLATYKDAVGKWRSGLSVLDAPGADILKAKELLSAGDRLRNEAAQEFDGKFSGK